MSASGSGYTVSSLGELGDGPGLKIRAPLGVTEFGVNAIILPARARPEAHPVGIADEDQQELYFVHRGYLTMRFDDGSRHLLTAGGLARVDPKTVRAISNRHRRGRRLPLRRRQGRLRRARRAPG